jgi:uncharacterized membrane protein YfcA
MLKIIVFIIVGVVGGVIGGMGMGGGTLTIPLLTLFTDTPQHLAQAINLIAFIPLSLAALIVHIKNGLVEKKKILPVAIPAVAASVVAAFISKKVTGKILSRLFGWFLIVLGVIQLVTSIISAVKEYKEKKKDKKSEPIV